MKIIFAIAWKDAIIRFASSSELLFFIILPVVFTFLLAGGTPSGNEDNRIHLLVVDESQTAISQQILAELENSTAVRSEIVSQDEAQKQFDDRRADAVLRDGQSPSDAVPVPVSRHAGRTRGQPVAAGSAVGVHRRVHGVSDVHRVCGAGSRPSPARPPNDHVRRADHHGRNDQHSHA